MTDGPLFLCVRCLLPSILQGFTNLIPSFIVGDFLFLLFWVRIYICEVNKVGNIIVGAPFYRLPNVAFGIYSIEGVVKQSTNQP